MGSKLDGVPVPEIDWLYVGALDDLVEKTPPFVSEEDGEYTEEMGEVDGS